MVTQTQVGTRLLLDTSEGVLELNEIAPGDWDAPRQLHHHPQLGQRYWAGHCLARDADGHTIYVGGVDGIRRSRDNGETWEAACDGLAVPDVWGLEAHPSRNGVVFAGTKPAAIFRSVDFGSTWRAADLSAVLEQDKWMYPLPPNTPQARSFAFDADQPNVVYAGVEEGGILLSEDGGETWVDRSAGLTWSALSPTPKADTHTVVVDPLYTNVVHATLGNGYHISFDRAHTWERRMNGLAPRYTRAIAVDRVTSGRVIVGTSEIPPVWMEHSLAAPQIGDPAGRVFETHDYGDTWQQLTNGLPERLPHLVGAITQHPGTANRWFVATVGGDVYESTDNAISWQLVLTGLPAILDVVI